MSRELRQQIRAKRRALSEEQQRSAEARVLAQVKDLPEIESAQHIALYASDKKEGELQTQELIVYLWSKAKKLYLPRIVSGKKGEMEFYSYTPDSKLIPNKYGVLEPDPNQERCILASELDIIITPLVVFDKENNRLGMGGGFYDRYLTGWQQRGKPIPVGIAHACQRVDRLVTEEWDVPLVKVLVG